MCVFMVRKGGGRTRVRWTWFVLHDWCCGEMVDRVERERTEAVMGELAVLGSCDRPGRGRRVEKGRLRAQRARLRVGTIGEGGRLVWRPSGVGRTRGSSRIERGTGGRMRL